jgi:hypothetical protein
MAWSAFQWLDRLELSTLLGSSFWFRNPEKKLRRPIVGAAKQGQRNPPAGLSGQATACRSARLKAQVQVAGGGGERQNARAARGKCQRRRLIFGRLGSRRRARTCDRRPRELQPKKQLPRRCAEAAAGMPGGAGISRMTKGKPVERTPRTRQRRGPDSRHPATADPGQGRFPAPQGRLLAGPEPEKRPDMRLVFGETLANAAEFVSGCMEPGRRSR